MSSVSVRFSIAEYERMINASVFDTRRGHNIELIRGELREMFPINFDHATNVDYLARWSVENIREDQATIRIQQPICCPAEEAVPQPDVAWIKPVKRRPWPLPEDVLLVIEVADSSLDGDQNEKAEIYAAEGIAEYWIVNIPGRQLEVHRLPREGAYEETLIIQPGKEASPQAFPAAVLYVSEMFAALDLE